MRTRTFNIMQYVDHPDTKKTLIDENVITSALAHKSIKRWAYILHDKDEYNESGEENNPNHIADTAKPPHYHIVCGCDNAIEVSVIAKWFGIPENFVDCPKGSGAFLDCVRYLTHEGEKQQSLGKFLYDDSEIIANFDFRKEIDERNSQKEKYGKDLSPKLAMRYDVLYYGKGLKQCEEQDKILYMEDIERLKKLRLEYIFKQKPPVTRINVYVSGAGRSGKGRISKAIARALFPDFTDDEDIFFEVGAANVSFEGYDGQPVIIWNDKRAGDLFHMLGSRENVFNVFDSHPTTQRQNVKFGSVNLCNMINIVNSVQPYESFLDGLAGEYIDKSNIQHIAEDKNQSYGRFPLIININNNDYDIFSNKGFVDSAESFMSYEEITHINGNLRYLAEQCSADQELLKELEHGLVQPVIRAYNSIVEKFNNQSLDKNAIRSKFAHYGTQNMELARTEYNELQSNDLPLCGTREK